MPRVYKPVRLVFTLFDHMRTSEGVCGLCRCLRTLGTRGYLAVRYRGLTAEGWCCPPKTYQRAANLAPQIVEI